MLNTKITVDEQESSFLVFDCTGNFAGDNTGGYGGPNPRKDQVTKNILEVTKPGSKIPIELDVTDYLPNKDNIAMEVFPAMIGQTGSAMDSGKYNFKYITTTTTSKGSKTVESYEVAVFVNSVKCCVDKLSPLIDGNASKDLRQQKILELSNLLEGIEKNIENGNYDKADSTIEYVKSQCKCQDC